jgi:signal transduction histidine kinase
LQSNALKFTNEGKVTIKAEVKEYINGHYLEISIIDTGVGIKAEE